MKFTLSWLKDHLFTKLTLSEILDLMTQIGLEVEDVQDPGAKLSDFTICKVKQIEPHPNADKLRICTVETIDGTKQIICGAPNAQAPMTTIYAPLGAYIPGLGFALDKKPRKIRGIESYGMLCSLKELDAGEDSDGIADLDRKLTLGLPAAQALSLSDPVIDFEVTPNRPDWLGVKGIARDLAAAGAGHLIKSEAKPWSGQYPCPVSVRIDSPEACAMFAGVLITGVQDGPSPDWLQKRLKAVGMTPKSLLIDITNYISLDRARPLHAYDADKLQGGIVARLGRSGEKLAALDDNSYEIDEDMCVIADESGAIGLGGIMGGVSTAISPGTQNVFLEAAWFDPARTARTGRKTGILSDARYRFERGVDLDSCLDGLYQAVQLILTQAGGTPSEPVIAGKAMIRTEKIQFYPRDVKRLTGLDVKPADMKRMIKDLGMQIEDAGDSWYLSQPNWRFDLGQSADIVEEIARLVGFDQLPQTSLPKPSERLGELPTPLQQSIRKARRIMAARGFIEAVTWSFMSREHAALFGENSRELQLANPVTSDLDHMRPTILANLAQAAQRGADHGRPGGRFFEAGPIYLGHAPEDQKSVITGLVQPAPKRHWQNAAPIYDAQAAKADLYAVLEALGHPADRFQIQPPQQDFWHPGHAARLCLGPKTTLAHFGALHPGILKKLGVSGPVYGFELNLSALPQSKRTASKTRPVLVKADRTPIRRDFAFLVEETVPAGKLVTLARQADKTLITQVTVFDVYQDDAMEAGMKSIALEVTIQPRGVSLKEADIEKISEAIIKKVETGTKGHLRR